MYCGSYRRIFKENLITIKMINVAKTVVDKDEKFLLIKRVPASKFFPGQWDFPGGKVHANEEPSNGAFRETREETSLRVIIDRLILEGEHEEKGK
jgi:8-oxo-dGTP diphosphatase